MYGNNYIRPFIMPNMGYAPMARGMGMGLRGASALGRTGGILSSFRNINFGGILNNVSRTLGVVKDAIPIVKEVRPMIGNMRSIVKIASAFKDETDTNTKKENTNTTPASSLNSTNETSTNTSYNSNEPNFFL